MSSTFVAAVLTLSYFSLTMVKSQDTEGSGSFEGIGDDEDDFYITRPTHRVIIPTPAIKNSAYEPSTTLYSEADPIYIEDEGSGWTRSSSNIRKWSSLGVSPMPPHSSVAPKILSTTNLPAKSAIVTHRIDSQAPQLQKKLRKVPVTAGMYVKWRIPEDTFFDEEDGNTRNLRLTLRYENGTIVSDSADWIRFDVKKQVVHLLPVDENDIGRWRFVVFALDSSGQNAKDTLEIVVRQFSGSRLINHQLEVEFSFINWKPNLVRNWEWMVMEKLRQVFQDSNYEHMIVRKLRKNPFVFGWTNSSLIEHSCPREEIVALYKVLSEEESAQRRLPGGRRLKNVMGKDVFVKSVDLKFFGACLEQELTATAGISEDSKNHGLNLPANVLFAAAAGGVGNSVPVIRNDIDLINVTAGELLRYKVPEDTCFDPEDGATNRLSLQLLTMNRKELSSRSWLRFDSKNQEFVGVPLEEEVGREEYQLVCSDSNGLSVIDGIVVAVLNRPFSERFGVEFVLEFADPVEFRKVDIVEGIANFFGDPSASNVILKSVSDHRVVWLNKSLVYTGCDDPEVSYMRSKLLSSKPVYENGNDDVGSGPIQASDDLLDHFDNLGLVNAFLVLRGSCILTAPHGGNGDFTSGSNNGAFDGNNRSIFHGIIPSGDYLMSFLVPAVIITLMLLMAILLALVLHRKRRAGKLNLFYSAESLPPRVPVILQDELVEVDANSYHKRTVVAAAAPSNPVHQNPEFERLIMPLNHNNIEIAQRPTPAYQFRQP